MLGYPSLSHEMETHITLRFIHFVLGLVFKPLSYLLPLLSLAGNFIYIHIYQLLVNKLLMLWSTNLIYMKCFCNCCRAWGVISLTAAFVWQLYTLYLMVQLHENYETGIRYSRYLQLACATFGKHQYRFFIKFERVKTDQINKRGMTRFIQNLLRLK